MRSLIFALCILFPASSLAGVFVGYSKSDITPTEAEAAESCLGGYDPFTRCGITTIHSAITVRSLAIVSLDQTLITAAIDTIGLGDSLITEVTDRVYLYSLGQIEPDDVFLTATHTHHGPDLQGLWGGVSTDYRERVVQATVGSILQAYFTKAPARVTLWTTDADVENRRGWQEADSIMNIVSFTNKVTRRDIATLVNMSAHPTLVPRDIDVYSADYIGSLRDTAEGALDSNVIFLNGIMGDVQPMVDAPLSINTAEEYGTTMGRRAAEGKSNGVGIRGDLKVKTTEFTHPVQNEPLIGAALAGFLDLDLNPDFSVTTRISVFQIGEELSGILFPGEALTRLGVPLRDALPGSKKLFIGLAGDSLGYFLPSDEFLIFPDRRTEEQVSLHPFIGDNIAVAFEDLIDAPYAETDQHWAWNHFLAWFLERENKQY